MINRRNFLGLGVGAGAAAALAACGSDGPSDSSGGSSSGGSGGGAASYWSLSGPPGEPVRKASVKRFNDASPDAKI
ncbi:twin-arginine translocation signal domain-containing protein, partial [Paractinoplanes hotanensis]